MDQVAKSKSSSCRGFARRYTRSGLWSRIVQPLHDNIAPGSKKLGFRIKFSAGGAEFPIEIGQPIAVGDEIGLQNARLPIGIAVESLYHTPRRIGDDVPVAIVNSIQRLLEPTIGSRVSLAKHQIVDVACAPGERLIARP